MGRTGAFGAFAAAAAEPSKHGSYSRAEVTRASTKAVLRPVPSLSLEEVHALLEELRTVSSSPKFQKDLKQLRSLDWGAFKKREAVATLLSIFWKAPLRRFGFGIDGQGFPHLLQVVKANGHRPGIRVVSHEVEKQLCMVPGSLFGLTASKSTRAWAVHGESRGPEVQVKGARGWPMFLGEAKEILKALRESLLAPAILRTLQNIEQKGGVHMDQHRRVLITQEWNPILKRFDFPPTEAGYEAMKTGIRQFAENDYVRSCCHEVEGLCGAPPGGYFGIPSLEEIAAKKEEERKKAEAKKAEEEAAQRIEVEKRIAEEKDRKSKEEEAAKQQREKEEAEAKRRQEEAKAREQKEKEEAEAKRKQEEAEAREQKEKEEAEAKKRQEEAEAREQKEKEEAEAKRRQEEAEAEEAEAKRRQEEAEAREETEKEEAEAKRRQEEAEAREETEKEEAEAKRRQEEAEATEEKEKEEAEAKRKQEEAEATEEKEKKEAEAKRRQEEAEAREQKEKEEAEAKRKQEEAEAREQKEQEEAEAKRKQEETEAREQKEKEEAEDKRRREEAEAREQKEKEEAEAKRRQEEAEATEEKAKEEAEAKRKQEEAEAREQKEQEEAEAKRKQEEAEAREQKEKEEAEAKRKQEEAEAREQKEKEEAEAKRKQEEAEAREQKEKEEAEAKRRQEEARQKEEESSRSRQAETSRSQWEDPACKAIDIKPAEPKSEEENRMAKLEANRTIEEEPLNASIHRALHTLPLRRRADQNSETLGLVQRDACVKGVREGNWLRLLPSSCRAVGAGDTAYLQLEDDLQPADSCRPLPVGYAGRFVVVAKQVEVRAHPELRGKVVGDVVVGRMLMGTPHKVAGYLWLRFEENSRKKVGDEEAWALVQDLTGEVLLEPLDADGKRALSSFQGSQEPPAETAQSDPPPAPVPETLPTLPTPVTDPVKVSQRVEIAALARKQLKGPLEFRVLAEDHSAPVRQEPLVQSPQLGKLERGERVFGYPGGGWLQLMHCELENCWVFIGARLSAVWAELRVTARSWNALEVTWPGLYEVAKEKRVAYNVEWRTREGAEKQMKGHQVTAKTKVVLGNLPAGLLCFRVGARVAGAGNDDDQDVKLWGSWTEIEAGEED